MNTYFSIQSNNMASEISDRYSPEYFLQNKVCRFCWRGNAVYDCTIKGNKSLIDKIKYCLDISITPKALTNKICGVCLNKINEFYKFKTSCHEINHKSETYFEEYLKTSNETSTKVERDSDHDWNDKLDKSSIHDDQNIKEEWIENFEKSPISDNQESDTIFIDIKSEAVPEKLKTKKNGKCQPRAPTYCTTCHTNLDTIEEFKDHRLKLHGIRDGIYICFGCGKEFSSRKGRECHEIHSCKQLKKGFKCCHCSLYLPRRGMYEAHTKQHRLSQEAKLPRNIFKCEHCVRCFRTKEKLFEHQVLHTVKKEYVCDHCGKVFTKRGLLTTHMLRHTGVKEKKCPYCDYRTYQQWTLKLHMRKHNGERPYQCDQCPQRCTTTSNLKVHKMRHAGVKQFQCTSCDKSFVNKGYLKEHMSEVHTSNCACTCDVCGITYRRKRALRRHMNAKHPGCYEYDKSKLALRLWNTRSGGGDGGEEKEGETHLEGETAGEEYLEDDEMENQSHADEFMIVVVGDDGNMKDEP